jgi:hypothetical protein
VTYIKVKLVHSNSDDAILLYLELDADRWEIRKVEIYSDGRIEFADEHEETGDLSLAEVPVPPFEKLEADPQYEPELISADEFERVWNDARENRRRANAKIHRTTDPGR